MYNDFKIFDYILFLLSLCVPMSISFYIGCSKNKGSKNAKDYLYGNEQQNLNSWSVGLSMFSGCISCLAIIGTVSETYTFGTQFMMGSLGSVASIFVVWYFILPVFCGNLDLKTPYEYFEHRYSTTVRIVMTLLSVIHSISFMCVVLYASIVSFNLMTDIPLAICTTAVGLICTIYTLIGGFAGVIWTDVIQASLMLFSCIFVMIKGVNMSQGITNVLSIAEEGQRVQFFNLDPNPFVRLTFWSAFIGMLCSQTAFGGCSPAALQRFMAVGSEKSGRISSVICSVGYAALLIMSGITGLSAYAFYKNCDPISNNQISSSTELLPLFVSDIAGYIPGFVGIFTAGLISAGLSSISADMNALSGLIYYDILQKVFKTNNWKISETVTMKIIILLYGIILVILAPIVAKSKHIYQVALMFSSVTCGTLVAVTILGTSFPKINAKGILCGTVTSLILLTWISYNQLNLDLSSDYVLPISTQNCTYISTNFTDIVNTFKTTTERTVINKSEPFILFKLSFMYNIVFGTIVTVLIAIIVSFITGFNDVSKMNPNLIIPSLRCQTKTVNEQEMINIDNKI